VAAGRAVRHLAWTKNRDGISQEWDAFGLSPIATSVRDLQETTEACEISMVSDVGDPMSGSVPLQRRRPYRGERAMTPPNASKLPLYVLTGVYYLMTAPRSVRRLQKKLLALA
jgi:hypothetical protein